MKRNIKMIIASLVALIVLVGGYFAAVYLIPENEEETKEPSDTVYLVNESSDNIEYVEFNTKNASYTIYNGKEATIEGYESRVIDKGKLSSMLYEFNGIAAEKIIEENSINLSRYALDKEDSYVLVKLKNGADKKIIIGASANFEGEYYVRMADSSTVYTISGKTAAILMKTPDSYRNLTVCEIDNITISEFSVKKNGKNVLSVKYDAEREAVNEYHQYTYVVTYPYKNAIANLDSLNMLFEKIGSVYADAIVEENPKNLSKYGLDKPYEFYVKDANTSAAIKLGSYTDDGSVYVMRDDAFVVYRAKCPFYETIKAIEPDDFVDRFIHLISIDSFESVHIKAGERTHILKANRKLNGDAEYSIDGKIKVKENFTPIYTKIIGLTFAELTEDKAAGKEKCTIIFTLVDKTVKEFTYYEYNSQYYIVQNESGLSCLVLKKDVDTMLETL